MVLFLVPLLYVNKVERNTWDFSKQWEMLYLPPSNCSVPPQGKNL